MMKYTNKQIWLINYPVMLSIGMEQLINLTDAIFLGHVGTTELGASAIAGIYYMALYMLGFGFSLGLQVVIARRNGEQNGKATGQTFFQGLFFLIALSVVLFFVSSRYAPFLLKRLVTSDEVYQTAVHYLHWRNWGLLFTFPALALRAFFVGITHTRILTASALTAAFFNILLNYLLIFGTGTIPPLGIAGAAIASSLSEGSALLVLLGYVGLKVDKRQYGFFPCFKPKMLSEVFNLSVWSMLHAFISIAPWLLFFIAIEHLGKNQLAIANVIRSISTLFFVIVQSFAATTGSLVSNSLGAGRTGEIMPLCRKIIRLSYAVGVPFIVLACLFARPLLGIYTPDPELVHEALFPLSVMLVNYLWAVPAYIYMNAVTGIGNTRLAFIFQVATIVLYLMYLFFIATFLKVPLAIYWTAEHLFAVSLFLMSYFWLKEKWQKTGKKPLA